MSVLKEVKQDLTQLSYLQESHPSSLLCPKSRPLTFSLGKLSALALELISLPPDLPLTLLLSTLLTD